jgi:hypothetical protein
MGFLILFNHTSLTKELEVIFYGVKFIFESYVSSRELRYRFVEYQNVCRDANKLREKCQ